MSVPHPRPLSGADYSAVELCLDNSAVVMLDQRYLPVEERYLLLKGWREVAEGIRDMAVRGAPAIGIAAAYGMVLAAREAGARGGSGGGDRLEERLRAAAEGLTSTRPTAVNLAWAVTQMLDAARWFDVTSQSDAIQLDAVEHLATVARSLHAADVEACREIGRRALAYVPHGATILTHCNAGALATGGYGTALGVVRAAHAAGREVRVLADETRPFLQGARLTAWELARSGISVEVIADSAAAHFLGRGAVDLVVVGSDRVAANGDIANKIGTYSLACAAHVHGCPFYVAAPWSTLDLECPSGAAVPIEERNGLELTHVGDRRLVPEGVPVRNPSFDVTPASFVSAIFTERGAIDPVNAESIAQLAQRDVPGAP